MVSKRKINGKAASREDRDPKETRKHPQKYRSAESHTRERKSFESENRTCANPYNRIHTEKATTPGRMEYPIFPNISLLRDQNRYALIAKAARMIE